MVLNLAAAKIIKNICDKKGIQLQGYKNLNKRGPFDRSKYQLDNKEKL